MAVSKPHGHEFAELGAALEAMIDEIVEQIVARAVVELPAEWVVERPELREPVGDLIKSSVLAEIEALKGGLKIPEACPEPDAYLARLAPQIGRTLTGLLWGYRAGHRAQWRCWNIVVDQLGCAEPDRRDLLAQGSEFFFSYADRLCDLVTIEYNEEAERLARGWRRRQANVVHDLLGGRDTDPAPLEYDIDGAHVAVISWGSGASDLAQELARISKRQLLSVSLPDNETWWSWLGAIRPRDLDVPALLARIDIQEGTGVAIGDQALGLEGFRESHRQAGHAQRAGVRTGRPVTHFRDVALEVLAGGDEAAAQQFVARELAGLSDDTKRMTTLRETLLAYFNAGHNGAAAAARLGIHEQTVANRLATIEQLLGVNVATRHAELETALRLRAYVA